MITPKHLAWDDPHLLIATLLSGMIAMLALHGFATGVRSRSRDYLLLGVFFLGVLINGLSNLFAQIIVATPEPYVGSWLTIGAFVVFAERYLQLPPSVWRRRATVSLISVSATMSLIALVHRTLRAVPIDPVVTVMDVAAAAIIVALYVFLAIHTIRGHLRARALLIFETVLVVGAISAMGVFKELPIVAGTVSPSFLDANLLFFLGSVVNGVLFSNMVGAELVDTRAQALATAQENHRLNELIANVSHEFRTPVTVISGTIRQLSAGRWGDSIRANRQHLSRIERNAMRLGKLVTNLLSLAQVPKVGTRSHQQTIDADGRVARLVSDLTLAAETRGIMLTAEATDRQNLIDVDPMLFDTAVLNLLDNALKYTPSGGRVRAEVSRDGPTITTVVKDTGRGIPVDHQDRVFALFARGEQDTAPDSPGLGIGLTTVRRIAVAHGGSVDLHSDGRSGTTVTLRLPASGGTPIADHAPDPDRVAEFSTDLAVGAQTETIAISHRDGAEVLLVEDDRDLAAILRAQIEDHFDLAVTHDGATAMEWLGAHVPQLIVTDVMMPRADGYALLEYVQDRPRLASVPVLFITARGVRDERIAALNTGVIDYIEKPFQPDELLAKIQTIISATVRFKDQFRDDLRASVVRFIDTYPERPENAGGTHDGDAAFVDRCTRAGLSDREQEIATQIRRGLSDKEIAADLGLSTKTVSNHNTRIFRKLQVSRRIDVATLDRSALSRDA